MSMMYGYQLADRVFAKTLQTLATLPLKLQQVDLFGRHVELRSFRLNYTPASRVHRTIDGIQESFMHTFFHGWRRKTGVVMLGLACVTASLWLRSRQFDDATRITVLGRKHIFRSHENRIDWWAWAPSITDSEMEFWTSAVILPVKEVVGEVGGSRPDDTFTRKWMHYDLSMMAMHRAKPPYDAAALWTVPYWPICWLSMLSSAYLILWKPGKRSSPH